MLVTIGVCTYRRSHLTQTLKSLLVQELPLDVSLDIIVVDNDPSQSGRRQVEALWQQSPAAQVIRYETQPKKNLAAVRNTVLELARGDWIGFIDDDETADTDWLSSLLKTAQTYNSDVVSGWVQSIYPDTCPAWISQGGYFDRERRRTGRLLETAATNNVLFKAKLLSDPVMRFREAYGLTGGEDADLFYRMYLSGAKIVYCSEAVVHETIESNRLCRSYLIKKATRIGETYSRYRDQHQSKSTQLSVVARLIAKIVLSFNCYLLCIPLGQKVSVKWLLMMYDGIGKLRGLTQLSNTELYS